jgi:hypothetical protein
MRALAAALLASGCAIGAAGESGVRGWAIGAAEISRCVTQGGETICEKVAGGRLSEPVAGALGAVGTAVRALLFGASPARGAE